MTFLSSKIGALPPRCNRGGCEAEKTGNSRGNKKPGSVGKSTLPGVEVAGFEPAAFWSRTKDLVGFSAYFRFLPGFAVSSRFCRFFPPVPRYFRVFPNGFKLDIRHFTGSTVRCNLMGCTHERACALPFDYCASSYSITSSGLDFFFPFQYSFCIISLCLFFALYAITNASAYPNVPGLRSLAVRDIFFADTFPTWSLNISSSS